WGKLGPARIDYSFILQTGNFQNKPIHASTLQTRTAVSLSSKKASPEISLQFDYASGGPRNGSSSGTYNPIYPGNEYVSINAFMVPANLVDVSPGVLLPITHKLGLELIHRWYWRYSVQDAVYGRDFATIGASLNTSARFVGTQPSADIRWDATPNLEVRLSGGRFQPTSAFQAAGLKAVNNLNLFLTFMY
ncbi:MAG: alginate export family protein, partial [Sphingomonadales bacterium]|nr:alginate export family protein [Sphingomonadales bacterium]